MKRSHFRGLVLVLGGLLLVLIVIGAERLRSEAGTYGPKPPSSAPVASVASQESQPELAPEPSAKLPAKAGEVPAILAKLDSDPVYQTIWAGPPDRLDAFLTIVSTLLCIEDNFSKSDVGKLRADKENDGEAAYRLEEIMLRTGSYPATFVAALKSHLMGIRSQSHLGVWAVGAGSDGRRNHDYSALAAWAYREDPQYFREMISARDHGKTMVWLPKPDQASAMMVTRPYFVFEVDAYEWLSQFGPLTPSEAVRFAKLTAEREIIRIDLTTMLNDYEQNELRADEKYKGKVVRFTATADAPRRGTIGGINVRFRTRNEHLALTCFFDDERAQEVSAISKGDTVNVRGQVEGLAIDVLLRKCEIER